MYVKINRNYCGHHTAVCERCLGRFLANPYGYERRCFEVIREDGSPDLTLDITTNGNHIKMSLNDETRLMMAADGWIKIAELAHLM